MASSNSDLQLKLDGKTDFNVGDRTYSWDSGFYAIDLYSGTKATATVNLTGSNWYVSNLRFGGSTAAEINDSASGTGRSIDIIDMNNNTSTTNSVVLDKTSVGIIFGSQKKDNITTGSAGVGSIDLRSGDDKVKVGSGYVDVINLGGGSNTIEVLGGKGVGTILAQNDADTATIAGGSVKYLNLGGGANKITVTSAQSYIGSIVTYDGNDTLTTGGASMETVNLGDGDNVVNVSAGTDLYIGHISAGRGNDTVTMEGTTEIGSIDLGRGDDVVTTSGFVQTIVTGRGKDTVVLKGAGSEYINLGRDADIIKINPLTGSGLVTIFGGDSVTTEGVDKDSDTADFSAFSEKIAVDLSVNSKVLTKGATFALSDFENVTGGKSNDTLVGSDAANILKGGSGNDILRGGLGADDLTGGSGKDTFVFASIKDSTTKSSGWDTIYDFSTSDDKIDLSLIDADTTVKGDQGFNFIGTKSFSGEARELRYEKQSSDTYIYGDVDGDKKADFAIHLDDAITMSKGYFIL